MKKYEQAMSYILESVVPNLRAGEPIPPERILARDSRVCLMTLRRAIDELCRQKVLSRIPEHRAVLASSEHAGGAGKLSRILMVRLSDELYYSELLLTIQQMMLENSRFVPVLMDYKPPPGSSADSALAADIPRLIQRAGADAVLGIPVGFTPIQLEKQLQRLNVPFLGVLGNGSCRNQLVIDFAEGIYYGLRFLHESGCRNLRYVGLDNQAPRQRGAGARRFFQEYFPTEDPARRIVPAYGTFEDGYNAFNQAFEHDRRVDGIFAHNDLCAGGIIMAAENHGLRIPRDLSIIGFDNLARSKNMVPRLTSMAVPLRSIAHEVLDSLDFIFRHGPHSVLRVVLQPQLYRRDSVQIH